MRKSVLEVSRKAFWDNVLAVKEYINDKASIMPVVKANGYGTYLNKDLSLMNKFSIVAVSMVQEAVDLRQMGYQGDIFVLNQPFSEEISLISSNNIIVGISSFEFLEEANKSKLPLRAHIELETGMGRTGVLNSQLDEFLSKIRENISVEGVYTHLSSADINEEFTNKQIEQFELGVNIVKKMFPNLKYVHCAASNGLLNFPIGICNLVRPGLILYGYPSFGSALNKIKLKPVARLKSCISFIKKVPAGTGISYGRSFVSSADMIVATVAIGYADGVRRELSNKGYVVVNGKRCKIIGKVCMDSLMIDISNVSDAKVGGDVYIFDNQVVTLDEVGLNCGTINYEVLATIGERVPRVFVD